MSETHYRMDPRLATVLGTLQQSVLGRQLFERVAELAQTAAPSPTGAAAAEALRAHRWLLDRAQQGPIQLTSAGYLPPADVKAWAPQLPTMADWIFAVSREVDTQPVLLFREQLLRTGLLRKHKGTLVLTAIGQEARRGPDELWRLLAARLIPRRPAFDEIAWVVVLLHFATGDGERIDTDLLAGVLGRLGWAPAGGKPVLASDAQWIVNDFWAAIGNVGPDQPDLLERRVSAEATSLVRDALLARR